MAGRHAQVMSVAPSTSFEFFVDLLNYLLTKPELLGILSGIQR